MKRFVLWWSYPIFLLVVVTTAAWLLRDTLKLANFTMVYILVVMVLAIQRSTRVALAAALVGFLSINFFLTEPYYTFIVADPLEVLDLIVFLVVAVIVGQLAARMRQEANAAQQRAREQEILYRLTRAFNQLAKPGGVYDALTSAIKTDLGAQDAQIFPGAGETTVPSATVHCLLLQAGAQVYGMLCATFEYSPTQETLRLLNACTSQAAMALQRIDLTERANKSEKFEEADRLKTAILRAVSHDLRTPITIIKSSAGNLHRLGEQLSPTERAELSETIEHEADHLDRLVGNLLDMSRLQAGSMTLRQELNSLEEVAGDIAAQIFERAKQERIRLDFPDDLPLANFDYGLIAQAVTNIVENSLRYEPPDKQVELRGAAVEDEVRLLVVNHGETIPPDEHELIMEPFYHGKDGRTGLGLAISKGIVEAHHGSLLVEETPGGGATFIIALKAEDKANDDIQNPRR